MRSVGARISCLFCLVWRFSRGFSPPLDHHRRRTPPLQPHKTSFSTLWKLMTETPASSSSSSSSKRPRVTTSRRSHSSHSTPLYAGRSFNDTADASRVGRLEELKQREMELAAQLATVRQEKRSVIRSRPLTIGVVGFGRFGQFIARSFAKYGRVVVTSRSDYTEIANGMGVTYVPLSDPRAFLAEGLDVIVFCVSILSFKATVKSFVPHIADYVRSMAPPGGGGGNDALPTALHGPLVVDVLSVKEHPRRVLLEHLPAECDILCTHPMFGPDSGKESWQDLNFVFEKTRIDQMVLHPDRPGTTENLVDAAGAVHEDSEAHVEGVDRIERFLSIWEEEGCRMVPMSCAEHDSFAANSQFVTHLMGRILGNQGLVPTPIDTMGFQSVLKLVDSTTADSFELFYGLYKYNQNSMDTIVHLQTAMEDVILKLKEKEEAEAQEEKREGKAEPGRARLVK